MENIRDKAKARVEFKIHLVTYAVVMTMLILINLFTSPGTWWFIWPLFGWGIGIIAHALWLHFSGGDPNLKERMIEKEMKKHSMQHH